MELVFNVTQEEDGGFVAEGLSHDIITEADDWGTLRANVREAVAAFFWISPAPVQSVCIWFVTNCWLWHEAAA